MPEPKNLAARQKTGNKVKSWRRKLNGGKSSGREKKKT
jgi:hypothetical protein